MLHPQAPLRQRPPRQRVDDRRTAPFGPRPPQHGQHDLGRRRHGLSSAPPPPQVKPARSAGPREPPRFVETPPRDENPRMGTSVDKQDKKTIPTAVASALGELRDELNRAQPPLLRRGPPGDQRPRVRPADAGADRARDASTRSWSRRIRPTQRVGGDVQTELKPVRHAVPMMSIDNTYNEDEVRAFDERVRKALGRRAAGVRAGAEDRRHVGQPAVRERASSCWPRRAGAGTSATTSPSTRGRSSRSR